MGLYLEPLIHGVEGYDSSEEVALNSRVSMHERQKAVFCDCVTTNREMNYEVENRFAARRTSNSALDNAPGAPGERI